MNNCKDCEHYTKCEDGECDHTAEDRKEFGAFCLHGGVQIKPDNPSCESWTQ